ncbi:MAG: hypothetical protein JWL71_3688, partial [Acidobacteria bacterium]|nr:hypothetical protein [Acidobacteriota bacterium]
MLSLTAIGAVLRRVPGIVWVAVFVLVLLSLGAFGLYRRGEAVGSTRVHVAALRDSVGHQRAKVDTAATKSDSVIRLATKDLHLSTAGRARTRNVLEAAK